MQGIREKNVPNLAKKLDQLVKEHLVYQKNLETLTIVLAKQKILDFKLEEYLPFDSNEAIMWFFTGGPTPADGIECTVRVEALTNHIIAGVPVTPRFPSVCLRNVLTQRFLSTHYWPTSQ